MKTTHKILPSIIVAIMLVGCSSGYKLANISRTRILIDKRFDAQTNNEANNFLRPYKAGVDSVMNPIVGVAADDFTSHRPESTLSNLLTDILVWSGTLYGEQPVFGVYNIGGIRSSFVKGNITRGDVLEVAPFQNRICFVTLSGEKVMELFSQMALQGGEGVSNGVNLIITKDNKLKSATINGNLVDLNKEYRVATIDYVAQGNDKMSAFKSATNIVSPQGKDDLLSEVIMKYFKEKAKKGEAVTSKIEGRIKIEQ